MESSNSFTYDRNQRGGAVPEGKTRICLSGFKVSHHTSRGKQIADLIAKKYSDHYETWFYFGGEHSALVNDIKAKLTDEAQVAKFGVRDGWSSPFVWFEAPDGTLDAKGGRDDFSAWVLETFPEDEALTKLASSEPGMSEVFFNKNPGTAQQPGPK